MGITYRIFSVAPSPAALEQARRLKATHAIVYSVGPCSSLTAEVDPVSGRVMDEFPIYFEDYPKVASVRKSADRAWLQPLRLHVGAMCERAAALGIAPVLHLYEPMLPLAFEREYPELVGVWRRPTQGGTVDVHTLLDPDAPATWDLVAAKYRELARDFPRVKMFVITTGDTASAYWCVPKAKMSVAERLASLVEAARRGVREAGSDATVCFRLWWRNFPAEYYRDAHRLTAELTGLENAGDLLCQIGRPHNDPDEVLPALFDALPADVPIMYKSTRMDIHEHQPLTHAAGAYPAAREQIIEISFEMYQAKPWPWCKVAHIRNGLDAVAQHALSGYVALGVNMGNNDREVDPERGTLGRMNTWLFERLSAGDSRSDAELVAAWLEKEYGSPQPQETVDALLDADTIVDDGIQWGRGINHRVAFASLHTTKLYWMYDGFIQPDFPYAIASPSRDLIEDLIAAKHAACQRAEAHVARLEAAGAAMAPALFDELHGGYRMLADYIALRRDWASYILMQYGIEKGVYPPERRVLGRMSRYVESFIANLVRLRGTKAGERVMGQISFPDPFPPT